MAWHYTGTSNGMDQQQHDARIEPVSIEEEDYREGEQMFLK